MAKQTRTRGVDGLPGDQKLLLQAMLHGGARWETFSGRVDDDRGEVCVGGFRWATSLDADGVPILHEPLRRELAKATRR